MRDTLPLDEHIWQNETGIMNLDSVHGNGTHWICYVKNKKEIKYFDSFGNLRPPIELINYFYSSKQQPITIVYNYTRKQSMKAVTCGHLCLQFLSDNVLFKR